MAADRKAKAEEATAESDRLGRLVAHRDKQLEDFAKLMDWTEKEMKEKAVQTAAAQKELAKTSAVLVETRASCDSALSFFGPTWILHINENACGVMTARPSYV
jgi:hypothetical protein